MNKIKKYKPMIWVKVSVGYDTQILNYEGTKQEFVTKIRDLKMTDFIVFPLHNEVVGRMQIKSFGDMEPSNLGREIKLLSLTQEQRENVKERIKMMKNNIGRGPTDNEVNNIIRSILGQNNIDK